MNDQPPNFKNAPNAEGRDGALRRPRRSAAQRVVRFARRAGFVPHSERVRGHRSAMSPPIVWCPYGTLEHTPIRTLPRRATSAVSLPRARTALPSVFGSGGTTENSPAFQRRVRTRIPLSPEGTAENISLRPVRRPFGTRHPCARIPALKRRAIFKLPSGTSHCIAICPSDFNLN
jgi:hypothetical protein